jgi:DNA-binding response OmpR family regulator
MSKVLISNGQDDYIWIGSLRRNVQALGESLKLVDLQSLQSLNKEDDLIILDAAMIGDEDLISIVKSIRANASWAPIIAVSSAPNWKEARRVLLAGVSDYIRKPYDKEAIGDMLKGETPALLRSTKRVNHSPKESQ